MPRFAANLSMMYTEVPFLERFGAAAKDGFKGVEFLFPYAFEAGAIAAELERHGLQQALFNTWPGDFDAGERGLASLPGREREFLEGVDRAIGYARALKCPRLHAMAGLLPAGADRAERRARYVKNLREAARRCADAGLDLLIEPINTRDIPGFFLNTQADAHAVLAEVGAPNLKVQMDLYHCQIVEGDLAMKIRQYLPTGRVGHFQIAGVPLRHEPDLGEVNHPYLFALLDELGWDGWVGCEYRPRAGTTAGLGWFAPYR
ncbi:MAG: hydroxypyruvate isomerase family protein [Burkholderiales bacterium]|nr:hydroxypyruvate isomerase family protein [Burkholderiales bacterium]